MTSRFKLDLAELFLAVLLHCLQVVGAVNPHPHSNPYGCSMWNLYPTETDFSWLRHIVTHYVYIRTLCQWNAARLVNRDDSSAFDWVWTVVTVGRVSSLVDRSRADWHTGSFTEQNIECRIQHALVCIEDFA